MLWCWWPRVSQQVLLTLYALNCAGSGHWSYQVDIHFKEQSFRKIHYPLSITKLSEILIILEKSLMTNWAMVYSANDGAITQRLVCLKDRAYSAKPQPLFFLFILPKAAEEKKSPSAALIKVIMFHIKNIYLLHGLKDLNCIGVLCTTFCACARIPLPLISTELTQHIDKMVFPLRLACLWCIHFPKAKARATHLTQDACSYASGNQIQPARLIHLTVTFLIGILPSSILSVYVHTFSLG